MKLAGNPLHTMEQATNSIIDYAKTCSKSLETIAENKKETIADANGRGSGRIVKDRAKLMKTGMDLLAAVDMYRKKGDVDLAIAAAKMLRPAPGVGGLLSEEDVRELITNIENERND